VLILLILRPYMYCAWGECPLAPPLLRLCMSMLVSWVVTPCGPVDRYQRFGVFNSEYVGSMFLRNAGIYVQVHTVLQPRRTTPISSSPWQPKDSCVTSTFLDLCTMFTSWQQTRETNIVQVHDLYTKERNGIPILHQTAFYTVLINILNENCHKYDVMGVKSFLYIAITILFLNSEPATRKILWYTELT
jgi:hypothetical protein